MSEPHFERGIRVSGPGTVLRQRERMEHLEDQSVWALLAAMPKAELHLHLDGCLRLQTIAELAQKQDVALPVPKERLWERCVAGDHCRDLVELLAYFALPIAVLQTPDALERTTYELCEDVSGENVRYVEIRFGPSLNTVRGATLDEIIAGAVRGWNAGAEAFGLSGGIILCALRHMPPDETQRVAEAGLQFLGQGVVGFDLAGDEAGFPVLVHDRPLLWARDAGYGMTIHAGEAAGAQSVRDTIDLLGVTRIGHGTHSEEDPNLLTILRERRTVLEMCPTSNVQTKSVPSLVTHPIGRYYRDGIAVTVNCDNRTVSDTTMTREMYLCQRDVELEAVDLARMTLTALEAGFSNAGERDGLVRQFRGEYEHLGLHV